MFPLLENLGYQGLSPLSLEWVRLSFARLADCFEFCLSTFCLPSTLNFILFEPSLTQSDMYPDSEPYRYQWLG